MQLAERLRADNIDPFTYHIKEFADLIDTHIEFIKKGIQSQDVSASDKEKRLSLLESLKSEAQRYRSLEQVTYRYWFNLNFRLSILATPKDQLHPDFKNIKIELLIANASIEDTDRFFKMIENASIEDLDRSLKNLEDEYIRPIRKTIWHKDWKLANSFPERVLIPTKHSLGIISINSAYETGVNFIGLKDKKVPADNRQMYPDDFFQHDILHASDILQIETINDLQLIKYVRHKIAAFPKFQREPLEYIFYEITYEDGLTLIDYFTGIPEKYRGRTKGLGIDQQSVDMGMKTLIEILRTNPYVSFSDL